VLVSIPQGRVFNNPHSAGIIRKKIIIKKKMKKKKIKVENIDHCGIVAGIIDEIGVVEKIDERLVSGHVQELISAGIAVKAMLINGLGFVSAPLYLFGKFYEGKGRQCKINCVKGRSK
jgi:hypothetical protein